MDKKFYIQPCVENMPVTMGAHVMVGSDPTLLINPEPIPNEGGD